MIPIDQAEKISEFALIPGYPDEHQGPPRIQETIVVHFPPGKTIAYDPDVISVEGILHVREQYDAGYLVSVFDLDANEVVHAKQ